MVLFTQRWINWSVNILILGMWKKLTSSTVYLCFSVNISFPNKFDGIESRGYLVMFRFLKDKRRGNHFGTFSLHCAFIQ